MNTYKTQVVAMLILGLMGVVTVIGVITLRVLDKKEPPVTHTTNALTNSRFYENTFTNSGYEALTHFRSGSTIAYEVPSKSRVQADTNFPPLTVEPSGSISTGWSKPGTELKTVWYVAISGLPRVIKLRAKGRLEAAVSTGLITVWSEEEWNDRPTLPGFVTEIEDATK